MRIHSDIEKLEDRSEINKIQFNPERHKEESQGGTVIYIKK